MKVSLTLEGRRKWLRLMPAGIGSGVVAGTLYWLARGKAPSLYDIIAMAAGLVVAQILLRFILEPV